MVPHSPEQNGVAERMNRTLMETARAEAVETAAYISSNNCYQGYEDTNGSLEWKRTQHRTHESVWLYGIYAHVPDVQRKKLNKKIVKLRFVGYSIQSKAYTLLDEKTSKIYSACNLESRIPQMCE